MEGITVVSGKPREVYGEPKQVDQIWASPKYLQQHLLRPVNVMVLTDRQQIGADIPAQPLQYQFHSEANVNNMPLYCLVYISYAQPTVCAQRFSCMKRKVTHASYSVRHIYTK